MRGLPNVLLLHFNNLLTNLGAELRRVARFLEIDIDEGQVPAMLEHCSIDYMREAVPTDSGINMLLEGGGRTFFHKGTNGRWREVLSTHEIARCDEVAAARLPPGCAHWLRTGELADA